VEASAQERGGFSLSRLTPPEGAGMVAAILFGVSIFLPWFTTSDNPNSRIDSAGVGPNSEATAWETFRILQYLLLAASIAPFVLAWIVVRGHALSWKPGEVTMIVGITAFILVICNGIILGRPDPNIEVGLTYGYLLAIVSSLGMAVSGFIRQASYEDAKKPPGTI
jgi:hypothetical protein